MAREHTVLLSSADERDLRRALDLGLYQDEAEALRAGIDEVRLQVAGFELYLREVVVPSAEKADHDPSRLMSSEDVTEYFAARRQERRNMAA